MDMVADFYNPIRLRFSMVRKRVPVSYTHLDVYKRQLYDPADKVYATTEVPADIEGALENADQKLRFRVALADLASPKLCEHFRQGQRHALYVGSSKVRGVITDHLAFDRNDIQFQIWIETGKKPVPLKIVINQKNLPASPQWTAVLRDWKDVYKRQPQVRTTCGNLPW